MSKTKSNTKSKTNTCGHPDRPHYARQMCRQCYRHWRYVTSPLPSRPPTKTNTCGHPDRPHYALGMCHPCYQRAAQHGRPIRVRGQKGRGNDVCGHTDRPHYALGMCEGCYQPWLHDRRRRTSEYQIGFLSQIEHHLYLALFDAPTPYLVEGGGAFALGKEIRIEGVRYWVGAAYSAPTAGPDGQLGQYFRLYPQ